MELNVYKAVISMNKFSIYSSFFGRGRLFKKGLRFFSTRDLSTFISLIPRHVWFFLLPCYVPVITEKDGCYWFERIDFFLWLLWWNLISSNGLPFDFLFFFHVNISFFKSLKNGNNFVSSFLITIALYLLPFYYVGQDL